MKILVDTHVLVWSIAEPARLPPRIVAKLIDETDEKLFSPVSVWEAAIKFVLKRPDFRVAPGDLIDYALSSGFMETSITSSAAARVADLPLHHRDPFDRLLIAQAIDMGAVLLTADAGLAAYAPHTLMLA